MSAEPDPPSPCLKVCTLDPSGGQCVGCFRTVDEIAGWARFTGAQKRAVLARLPERRAQRQRERRAARDARRAARRQ